MACYKCEPNEEGISYIVAQLHEPERILLRDFGALLEDGYTLNEAFKELLRMQNDTTQTR